MAMVWPFRKKQSDINSMPEVQQARRIVGVLERQAEEERDRAEKTRIEMRHIRQALVTGDWDSAYNVAEDYVIPDTRRK